MAAGTNETWQLQPVSPVLHQPRELQLIPRWKLTWLHQARDCLFSLSAVRLLLHFQLRTEQAVSGSWTEGICVTHAKALSTRHAGFSSPHC